MSSKDSVLALVNDDVFDLIPMSFFTCQGRDPIYPEGVIPEGHLNFYRIYYALAKHYQPRTLLEIGVRLGYSLASMAVALDGPSSITGWDLQTYLSWSQEAARESLDGLNLPHEINLETVNSQEIHFIPRHYDLISIDGDHSYKGKRHDLRITVGATKVVLIDDFSEKHRPDVFRAVMEHVDFFDERISDFYTIEQPDFPTRPIKGTAVIEYV